MSVQEAKELFGEIIEFDGWQTNIETFVEIFGEAFPNPTYAKLMAVDQGRKGYQAYFEHAVAEGKLPL